MFNIDKVSQLIKDVPDFPKPNILFKDITPVLENGSIFSELISYWATRIPKDTTKFMAIEARGFILAAALTQHFKAGMVLVRKKGKLPRATFYESYNLEYGEAVLEIHKDALSEGDRVVLIDDILATGGTAQAVYNLCKQTGALFLGAQFLLEIQSLEGREGLKSFSVDSLIIS